jgi:hypothetical protein
MIAEPHYLNSLCDSACPIVSLHQETRNILRRYPQLDLAPEAAPIYLQKNEDDDSFRLIVLPPVSQRASSSESREMTFDGVNAPDITRKSFHDALENFDFIRLIGNPVTIFERGDTFTEFTPLYNPGKLSHLPWPEVQAILDWHRRVLNWLLNDLKQLPASIPVLPINVLWLLDTAHFWFVRTPSRRRSTRVQPVTLVPLAHLLTHSKGISPDVSAHLCYHRNPYVRQVAAESPHCPEEARVAAVLLGLPAEPKSAPQPI